MAGLHTYRPVCGSGQSSCQHGTSPPEAGSPSHVSLVSLKPGAEPPVLSLPFRCRVCIIPEAPERTNQPRLGKPPPLCKGQ